MCHQAKNVSLEENGSFTLLYFHFSHRTREPFKHLPSKGTKWKVESKRQRALNAGRGRQSSFVQPVEWKDTFTDQLNCVWVFDRARKVVSKIRAMNPKPDLDFWIWIWTPRESAVRIVIYFLKLRTWKDSRYRLVNSSPRNCSVLPGKGLTFNRTGGALKPQLTLKAGLLVQPKQHLNWRLRIPVTNVRKTLDHWQREEQSELKLIFA